MYHIAYPDLQLRHREQESESESEQFINDGRPCLNFAFCQSFQPQSEYHTAPLNFSIQTQPPPHPTLSYPVAPPAPSQPLPQSYARPEKQSQPLTHPPVTRFPRPSYSTVSPNLSYSLQQVLPHQVLHPNYPAGQQPLPPVLHHPQIIQSAVAGPQQNYSRNMAVAVEYANSGDNSVPLNLIGEDDNSAGLSSYYQFGSQDGHSDWRIMSPDLECSVLSPIAWTDSYAQPDGSSAHKRPLPPTIDTAQPQTLIRYGQYTPTSETRHGGPGASSSMFETDVGAGGHGYHDSGVQVAGGTMEQDDAQSKTSKRAEADWKRQKFLERNRQAASKCRKKKSEWTKSLENAQRAKQVENTALKAAKFALEADAHHLRQLFLITGQSKCPCQLMRDYNAMQMERAISGGAMRTTVFSGVENPSAMPLKSESADATEASGELSSQIQAGGQAGERIGGPAQELAEGQTEGQGSTTPAQPEDGTQVNSTIEVNNRLANVAGDNDLAGTSDTINEEDRALFSRSLSSGSST